MEGDKESDFIIVNEREFSKFTETPKADLYGIVTDVYKYDPSKPSGYAITPFGKAKTQFNPEIAGTYDKLSHIVPGDRGKLRLKKTKAGYFVVQRITEVKNETRGLWNLVPKENSPYNLVGQIDVGKPIVKQGEIFYFSFDYGLLQVSPEVYKQLSPCEKQLSENENNRYCQINFFQSGIELPRGVRCFWLAERLTDDDIAYYSRSHVDRGQEWKKGREILREIFVKEGREAMFEMNRKMASGKVDIRHWNISGRDDFERENFTRDNFQRNGSFREELHYDSDDDFRRRNYEREESGRQIFRRNDFSSEDFQSDGYGVSQRDNYQQKHLETHGRRDRRDSYDSSTGNWNRYDEERYSNECRLDNFQRDYVQARGSERENFRRNECHREEFQGSGYDDTRRENHRQPNFTSREYGRRDRRDSFNSFENNWNRYDEERYPDEYRRDEAVHHMTTRRNEFSESFDVNLESSRPSSPRQLTEQFMAIKPLQGAWLVWIPSQKAVGRIDQEDCNTRITAGAVYHGLIEETFSSQIPWEVKRVYGRSKSIFFTKVENDECQVLLPLDYNQVNFDGKVLEEKVILKNDEFGYFLANRVIQLKWGPYFYLAIKDHNLFGWLQLTKKMVPRVIVDEEYTGDDYVEAYVWMTTEVVDQSSNDNQRPLQWSWQ